MKLNSVKNKTYYFASSKIEKIKLWNVLIPYVWIIFTLISIILISSAFYLKKISFLNILFKIYHNYWTEVANFYFNMVLHFLCWKIIMKKRSIGDSQQEGLKKVKPDPYSMKCLGGQRDF